MLAAIQWSSWKPFIGLAMLSVIMVGQNIMSRCRRPGRRHLQRRRHHHEAEQIQKHLKAQDAALNALLDKVASLEAALAAKCGLLTARPRALSGSACPASVQYAVIGRSQLRRRIRSVTPGG
ncbi:MAG: hypothetical protein U0838_07105 [Chloroflexota bacterium]